MGCASSADAGRPSRANRTNVDGGHVVVDEFNSTLNPLLQTFSGVAPERVASAREEHAEWAKRTARQQRRARARPPRPTTFDATTYATGATDECPFSWVRDDTAPTAVMWPPTDPGALALPRMSPSVNPHPSSSANDREWSVPDGETQLNSNWETDTSFF
uniref:Uncharacterized protein n=1 Tax=Neobodo designis TaxID=312471 RepID=A0A6U4WLD6_NEODS|mmetsp:Transcript_5031/g.15887  ORF Transcript_5031/g.15887 Transcript_5031/m.15887 type:complete len:160 (+) Transcript_5031:50-529(+)